MKWSITILILLVLAWGIQAIHYYPKLPDRVATHFNWAGQPDNWGSKETMVIFSAVAVGVILFSVVLTPCILIRYLPDRWINLPNRDYWQAAERRDDTKRYMQTMIIWFGVLTMGLIVALFAMVNRANLREPVQLSNSSWLLIAGYVFFTAIWSVFLIGKFYRKKDAIPS